MKHDHQKANLFFSSFYLFFIIFLFGEGVQKFFCWKQKMILVTKRMDFQLLVELHNGNHPQKAFHDMLGNAYLVDRILILIIPKDGNNPTGSVNKN